MCIRDRVNDKGYTAKISHTDVNGKPIGLDDVSDVREWSQLYSEFLSPEVKVTSEKVRVGKTDYACKVYTLEGKDGASSSGIWFITEKPGYVAKWVSVLNDPDGKECVSTSTLEELK